MYRRFSNVYLRREGVLRLFQRRGDLGRPVREGIGNADFLGIPVSQLQLLQVQRELLLLGRKRRMDDSDPNERDYHQTCDTQRLPENDLIYLMSFNPPFLQQYLFKTLRRRRSRCKPIQHFHDCRRIDAKILTVNLPLSWVEYFWYTQVKHNFLAE